MTLTRAALAAAIATTVSWTFKAIAIGLAGGDDRSPLEGPLFLLGLALAVVTAVLLGLAAAGRRRWWWKVIGVAGACLLSVLALAVNGLVKVVEPAQPGWVWGEVNLWVLAVVLLVAAIVLTVRRRSVLGGLHQRDAAGDPVALG